MGSLFLLSHSFVCSPVLDNQRLRNQEDIQCTYLSEQHTAVAITNLAGVKVS